MRVELAGKAGNARAWAESAEQAGYVLRTIPMVGDDPIPDDEIRCEHPAGSVIRIFPNRRGEDLAYCYPPGGTDRPTGPLVRPDFIPDTSRRPKAD